MLIRNGYVSPHSARDPDTLPPSAAVYQGDWKLFRFFHDGPSGSHRHSLYHLAEDIGERNDLSSQEPERIATMSAAMDEFITNTGAVHPKTNPFYDASVNLLNEAGWKAHKSCALSVLGEHVKVTAREAKANFNIRLSPLVGSGKLMMRVRMKSNHPGKIHLRWEEKGVKPVYFSDRLVRTDGYLAEQ